MANKNVKRLGRELRNLAENSFQAGLQFLRKGDYRNARQKFLLTLRLWPDHPEAIKMLSSRKRTQAQKYVEYVIKPGDTLAKLAKRYYGDYHHFTTIAEYNGIPDPTRVKVGQKIIINEIEGLPFFAETHEAKIKQVSKADVRKPEDEIEQEEEIVTVILPDSGKPEDEIAQDEEIVTVIVPDLGKQEEKIEKKEEIKQVSKADVGKLEDDIKQDQKNKLTSETDWVGVVEEKKNEEEKEEIHEEAEVLRMYLEQGINLFNESKYQEAIVEFNKFVNVNSDNETALEYLYKSHFQQAMLLFMKQDYLSAKKEFESSLQYNSDCEKCNEYLKKTEDAYKDFHYAKGISYFREEKLTEALREWEMVLAIDPEYKGVEQNINKVKTLLKKLEEIQKSYEIH
ncbi:MAG: LysM peptidoglycan-binding domain-containing protein [bacterium]